MGPQLTGVLPLQQVFEGDRNPVPETTNSERTMKKNHNVTSRHAVRNPNYRPTRHWNEIDEQMEREALAIRGSMRSAGQLRTVNRIEEPSRKPVNLLALILND